MHERHKKSMGTLVYVDPNEPIVCAHEADEVVEFTTKCVTYDGIEEYVTKGRACVECGLLLEGSLEEGVTTKLTEIRLMDLLRKNSG